VIHDLLRKITGKQATQWFMALKRFLRQEHPCWGVPVTIDVATDGRTGEQWIATLKEQGNRVGDYAKQLLCSKEFVVTKDATYKLAVILGDELSDRDRTNRNIRAEAARRGYINPPAEVAPYLREMFSDKDLERTGLCGLIIMHEPIAGSDDYLVLLGGNYSGIGRWLSADRGHPEVEWRRETGFVFLVPSD